MTVPAPTRTLLANLINDVMTDAPVNGYVCSMAAVTPRKLWLANPGDCVVLLAPPSAAFRDHVEQITGMDTASIDIVAPDQLVPVHALDVVDSLGAADRVAATGLIEPFALDDRTVSFARSARIGVYPYTSAPHQKTLDAVYRINTKDGFRDIASSLGLPVAPGGWTDSATELARRLTALGAATERAIVKVSRSSNGSGTFVVDFTAAPSPTEQVERAVCDRPLPPGGWVFEQFLAFDAAPSVELVIDDTGVADFYTCWQRTRNNAWTGMITPADPAGPADLTAAARRIGEWLGAQGYRGYFDVDFGIVGESFVATEANVRRTGGTYLEALVRRLSGGHHRPWRAEARRGEDGLDFARAVKLLQHAGLVDPKAEAHVVLTADTREVDGLWRYLVVGQTEQAVADVEDAAARILRLV